METKIIHMDALGSLKESLGIRFSGGKYNHQNHFIKGSTLHAHPYEMITNTFKHEDYAGSIQINDILCLDPKFYPNKDISAYPGRPIWVEKKLKKCDHPSRNHIRFAALCATALTHLDLKDRFVCDFGAGDGFLSIIALRHGARHVLAIERDAQLIDNCAKHLEVNGFGPLEKNPHFNWHTADLQNMIISGTYPEALSRVQIAVANIGPQYGNVHADIIELLGQEQMQNCTYFVGGGYSFEVGTLTALRRLPELGFSIIEKFTCSENDGDYSPRLLSFIAKRNG